MSARLTKAQREMLVCIQASWANVSETYRPAKKLVEMGFAVWKEGRYGSMHLHITPAGREALKGME